MLVFKKIGFLLLFSCFTFIKLNAQNSANAVHIGIEVGNFYENYEGALIWHTGSRPLTFGYDYYPVEKLGFRLSAYLSFQSDFSESLNPELQSNIPNAYGSRFTKVRGLKYSAKFWLNDITETKYNLGFETGIGLMQYSFESFYSVSRPNSFLQFTTEDSKILTPFHLGVAAKLFGYYEVSLQYNYFPALEWQTETITFSEYDATFSQPMFRRGFLSGTLRVFVPWN